MRVTNKLIADAVTHNLFRRSEQMLKVQNQLSSGRRITKPSDDPVGMSRVLDYRHSLAAIDQYTRNIDMADSRLSMTEAVLGNVGDLLVRAEELGVSQATGTANADSRAAAAEEIKNIYEQVMQLANTKLGESYLFAGYATETVPFSRDADPLDSGDDYSAVYHGDWGIQEVAIGQGQNIAVNHSGGELFMGQSTAGESPPSGVNIFDLLEQLKAGMENNAPATITGALSRLEAAQQQILAARTEAGARLNRLETTKNHWADFKVNIQSMLTETEDIDLAGTLTEASSQETAYQAALAAGSMIIRPSLIEFLG